MGHAAELSPAIAPTLAPRIRTALPPDCHWSTDRSVSDVRYRSPRGSWRSASYVTKRRYERVLLSHLDVIAVQDRVNAVGHGLPTLSVAQLYRRAG